MTILLKLKFNKILNKIPKGFQSLRKNNNSKVHLNNMLKDLTGVKAKFIIEFKKNT